MLYSIDVDASGKPGSGILTGNNRWFGSYSQCKKQQNSRYCLASFSAIVSLEADKHQVSEGSKTSKFYARNTYIVTSELCDIISLYTAYFVHIILKKLYFYEVNR